MKTTTKRKIAKKTKEIQLTAKHAADEVGSELSHYKEMAQEVVDKFKTGELKQIAKEYLKDVDYEALIKETLKVVIPILAVRFLSSRGRPSARREEMLDCAVNELKDVLKKKKVI